MKSKTKSQKLIGLGISAMMLSSVIAGCTATDSTEVGNAPLELTLVSYAVTQSAYDQIIPQFVEEWKKETGQDVVINASYGGSGSQARAVIDGLQADIVALALALDTKEIEKAGLIEPGWEEEFPNNSIVHKSVAAIVPRDESIRLEKWSDLARDDVKAITANPKTSGGARWNFLVLWGAVTQAGGTEQEAEAFVEKVYKNVPILPRNAREASDVFYQQGQGNVLINYENEVILAEQQGDTTPYFIPTDYNISIDNPIAIVDQNIDAQEREVAEAFINFLYTPEAQRKFAQVGFRPVDETVAQEFVAQYPPIENLFTVQDLGGWDAIQAKFFDDQAFFDKIQQKIARAK